MAGSYWPGSAGPLLMTGPCLIHGALAVTSVTLPIQPENPVFFPSPQAGPGEDTARPTAGFRRDLLRATLHRGTRAKIIRPARRRWWGVKTSFALMASA